MYRCKDRENHEPGTGDCVECMLDRIAELEETEDRLRGALEKYGRHCTWCDERTPCSCGYSAALGETEE